MEVHNIALLPQRGRLSCSPEKKQEIEMHTAHHLDVLQREFQSSEFDKNLIDNLDETYFVINVDNSRTW